MMLKTNLDTTQLKPIGTEYWDDWVYIPTSTNPYEFRIKNRVVEYVAIEWYGKT